MNKSVNCLRTNYPSPAPNKTNENDINKINIRLWQFNHFQYLSNALNDEIWQANQAFMTKIVRDDRGLLNHWRMNTREFSPAFNEMFESIIVEGS